MKNISLWAARHIFYSRSLIVMSHILLLLISMVGALFLFLEDIFLPKVLLMVLAHLTLLGIIVYPNKKEKCNLIKYNYSQQKVIDISLAISGSMLAIFLFSSNMYRLASTPVGGSSFTPSFIVNRSHTHSVDHINSKRGYLKSIKSNIRTELLKLKKQYKAQGNKKASKGVKVLLILLTLGIAVLLAVTIAFLGCSVYCTASPVLGVAVWIIGWGGLVWLTIAIIKRIIKGKRSDVSTQ